MKTGRPQLKILILGLHLCFAALSFSHCDARRRMNLHLGRERGRGRGGRHSEGPIMKPTNKIQLSKILDVDDDDDAQLELDASNTQPYGVSSPFSLPPYDSLAPIALPENTPPLICDCPPFTPLPPSCTTIPFPPPSGSSGGEGYSPPFPPPSSSSTPILPFLTPPPALIPSPPESTPSPIPNTPQIVPGSPPAFVPSPTESTPSPIPNTPQIVPGSPPTFVPSPTESTPSPIPNPPQIVIGPPPTFVPSPTEPVLSPPYSFEPSPPNNVVPSPSFNVPSGPSIFIPSPPVFQPPVVYPPPAVPPPTSSGPNTNLWCVAKPTVPDPIIQEAMNYACASGADCDSIQPNGSCFQPNTLIAHASYAFNSYWQRTRVAGGTCDFGGTAMLVTVDPSYDGCHFVY